jgi:hypothetical protein
MSAGYAKVPEVGAGYAKLGHRQSGHSGHHAPTVSRRCCSTSRARRRVVSSSRLRSSFMAFSLQRLIPARSAHFSSPFAPKGHLRSKQVFG